MLFKKVIVGHTALFQHDTQDGMFLKSVGFKRRIFYPLSGLYFLSDFILLSM